MKRRISAREKANREKIKDKWSAETDGKHRSEVVWAPGEREKLIADALAAGRVTKCEAATFVPLVFAGPRRLDGPAQIIEPVRNRYIE